MFHYLLCEVCSLFFLIAQIQWVQAHYHSIPILACGIPLPCGSDQDIAKSCTKDSIKMISICAVAPGELMTRGHRVVCPAIHDCLPIPTKLTGKAKLNAIPKAELEIGHFYSNWRLMGACFLIVQIPIESSVRAIGLINGQKVRPRTCSSRAS